jgi:putative photosynthetic complex assembly protein 2
VQDFGTAILVTLVTWWFSTGAILYLDGLPRWTFRWSMGAAGLIAAGALFAVHRLGPDATSFGAYAGFVAAILLWGFVEIAFLLGVVTGSWRADCPPELRGWGRFRLAARTVSHHELMLVGMLVAIAVLSWDQPNQTALWTFAVLWAMRLSTKLNIFLGVPNITEQFLPEHLRYLKSFFRHRPMNLLFPLSVTAGTVTTLLLAVAAADAEAGSHAAVSLTLLATIAGLGVIEHWFLVMPLDVGQLWSWGLHSHGARPGPATLDGAAKDTTIAILDLSGSPETTVVNPSLTWTQRVPCAGANP